MINKYLLSKEMNEFGSQKLTDPCIACSLLYLLYITPVFHQPHFWFGLVLQNYLSSICGMWLIINKLHYYSWVPEIKLKGICGIGLLFVNYSVAWTHLEIPDPIREINLFKNRIIHPFTAHNPRFYSSPISKRCFPVLFISNSSFLYTLLLILYWLHCNLNGVFA